MRHLVCIFSLWLAACGGGGDSEPEQVSTTPENTGDGWTISSPAAEGIDTNAVNAVLEDIRDGDYPGVDSMVVIRHGKLVAEGYFNGFGRDSLHDLRSTGKSFTSALAGIAIERGAMNPDRPAAAAVRHPRQHGRTQAGDHGRQPAEHELGPRL
jgi:CubicO group peptidase (beta-lactamase class C family)